MKKNLPHVKFGWELVPDSPVKKDEKPLSITGTKKKKERKWKSLSLSGYKIPPVTFEEHPYTKKLLAESLEKTLKEREADVVKKEKELLRRERDVAIREDVCRRFKTMEIGVGRGASKQWREICYGEALEREKK